MVYLKQKIINRFRSIMDVVSQYNYVSFDIFDTLIIRKCEHPHNIFNIMERLFNDSHNDGLKIHDFRQVRIESEVNVRRMTKKEEVTLEDIYHEIPYDKQIRSELQFLEERTEIEQCVGRTEIIQIYNKCKEEGKVVCITSDMYLRKDVVIEILRKNNIKYPNYILLSSNVMKTKRTGSLFDELISTVGVNSNQILHIGDNVISDFVRPLLKGMDAYWIN